jgi:hypothetical protein
VAREARHADADRHHRREGNQGRRLHVQGVTRVRSRRIIAHASAFCRARCGVHGPS